jgi:hypothetical protein
MGDEVGVFYEREVKHLSRRDRATLKKSAYKQLRSPSIRKLVRAKLRSKLKQMKAS